MSEPKPNQSINTVMSNVIIAKDMSETIEIAKGNPRV